MSDVLRVAEDVAQLRRLFGSLFSLESDLLNAGSLEQAANESRAAVDSARRDLGNALAEADAAAVSAQEAGERAVRIVEDATAEAGRITTAAREEASAIEAGANADFAAAQAIRDSALADLDGQIAKQQAVLDDLTAQVAVADARLAAALQAIEDLKGRI